MAQSIQPQFLAVDFYCGAGGTTRGLLDAGGYVIAGIDNDLTCEATYTSNNRNTTLDRAGPRFLGLDMFPASDEYPDGRQAELLHELRASIPVRRSEAPGVPLLFAICAPCQSFTRFVQRSLTNERRDARKQDANLLDQTLPFITEFKPELVMIENVVSMLKAESHSIWNAFFDRLRILGYDTDYAKVCASNFGVPQRRRRLIGIAIRRSSTEAGKQLEEPDSIPTSDPNAPLRTVRDAIGSLPPLGPGETHDSIPNHRCRNLSALNRRRLAFLDPGESNHKFAEADDDELMLPCHRRLTANGTPGFADVYTRMDPDRPAPTITTRFHSASNGRYGHYDQEQVRAISLREGATLQSFPASYRFHSPSMDGIARMIGNAVPPTLAAFMARHLAQVWESSQVHGRQNHEF